MQILANFKKVPTLEQSTECPFFQTHSLSAFQNDACLQVLYRVFYYLHYFSHQNRANYWIIDITITIFFPWNGFLSVLVFLLLILILSCHLNFYACINITNNTLHASLQVWELDLFLHWYPFHSILVHTCLCVFEAITFNLSTFASKCIVKP